MELSSSVGSSKRVRSPGSMAHVVSCVVDGCNSDLSGCREYHRRHKVCELHSKTPKVTIKGRELRFCQQCSRFHSLMEFDEGKRSCRKRLDGHNRRRRKPRTETTIFHSSEKGSRYLSFKNLQIPQSAVVRSGNIKSQDHATLFNSQSSDIDKHNPFTSSLAQSQFLCGTDHILPEAFSGGQLLLYPNSASKNYGKSDGALSLLSSAALTETRVNIGSSHMVHPAGPITMSQSLPQNQHFSGLGQFPFITRGMITNPIVSDQDQTNITALHFEGARQNRFDGSSGSDASQQKLWFGWI